MGFTNKNDSKPESRGVRVARYVEAYMRSHPGLQLGEFAFRLKVDARDLRRLLNDKSCGWRLEDDLAAYFGPDFVDAVFAPVIGTGRSRREIELETELAAISARRDALERDRALRRRPENAPVAAVRLVNDQDRAADI